MLNIQKAGKLVINNPVLVKVPYRDKNDNVWKHKIDLIPGEYQCLISMETDLNKIMEIEINHIERMKEHGGRYEEISKGVGTTGMAGMFLDETNAKKVKDVKDWPNEEKIPSYWLRDCGFWVNPETNNNCHVDVIKWFDEYIGIRIFFKLDDNYELGDKEDEE